MSKEALHGSYLDGMKAEHGDKPVPSAPHRAALVVGGSEFDSIGAAIYFQLLRDELLGGDGFGEVDAPTVGNLDVTKVGNMTEYCKRRGPFDTLILANGRTSMNWIEDYDPIEMQRVVADSLVGSMLATSEFVKATIDDPVHKHIVFIGSMAHRGVLNASAPYCAAKAGLNHFARCMGWELTPKGYTVHIVHPSNTEGTAMTEKTILEIMKYRELDREAAEAYWASINLKQKWLQPSDIADTVSYLVSGRASYASGTAIELSGGQR